MQIDFHMEKYWSKEREMTLKTKKSADDDEVVVDLPDEVSCSW